MGAETRGSRTLNHFVITSCSYENPSAAITGLSITLNVMGQMNSLGGSLLPTNMLDASDVLAALAVVPSSFQGVGGAGRGHDVVFRSLGCVAGALQAARVCAASAACLRANKAATWGRIRG